MSDLNHDLHARAVKALSENEVRKMEHCVGFDRKKIYHRGGTAYYKPYRNYYDAAGTDMRVWERLVEKGRKALFRLLRYNSKVKSNQQNCKIKPNAETNN